MSTHTITTSFHPISTAPTTNVVNISKRLDAVPGEKLVLWAMRLYSLVSLSWSYIDTICEICIIYRINDTKKICREIKALRREYHQFRQRDIDDQGTKAETERAYDYEDIFRKDFARMNAAIKNNATQQSFTEGERLLYTAVQQALILIDATKIYARWVDRQITSYGVWVCDYVLLQTEFLKVSRLVDKLNKGTWMQTDRHKFAQAFSNRLHIFGKICLTNE